jgi:UDP-glucose 4-epimerase
MDGIVVRLSNAFGAPMQKEVNCWMLLVNDLCRQAVETRKLVLQTSGLQHRDFIGLTSVCRVVEALALNTQSRQSVICNVGSGVSQSLLAMTRQIQQRCVQVFGFEPELQRLQSALYEHHPELTFRTDNLAALGINFGSLDASAEIDSLLCFCHSSFLRL